MNNGRTKLKPDRPSSLSAAEKISVRLYEVFVPRLFLQDAEAAAFYGSMAQDNPMAQKEQEQGDMRVNLPGIKMADLFVKGCKPWFLKPETSRVLYLDLVEYLKEAEHHFNNSPNSNRWTPEFLDNLLKIENFAQWLLGIAKPYLTEVDTGPTRDQLAGYRRITPLARKTVTQLEEESKQREHFAQDHTRVVDEMIERHVARSRRGWH
jgi:hypothetical protein